MQYFLYDHNNNLRGQFTSIYDLQIFMDGIRNSLGEQYPNTERMSPFDYIKKIGWCWECVDNYVSSDV